MSGKIEGFGYLIEGKCPVCGRVYTRTTEHVYKFGRRYACSYTCMRVLQKRAPAPNKGGRPRTRTRPVGSDVEKTDKRLRKTGKARVDECIANILERTGAMVGLPPGSPERKAQVKARTMWMKELEAAVEEMQIETETEDEYGNDGLRGNPGREAAPIHGE